MDNSADGNEIDIWKFKDRLPLSPEVTAIAANGTMLGGAVMPVPATDFPPQQRAGEHGP